MSIHIYHPNKAVKGFACSFWYSDRDNSLFATLVKQSGWDENNGKGNGTFKGSMSDPTKHINIKLSEIEACGILDCIDRNRPFSSYHDFGDSPKAISFIPYVSAAIKDVDGNETPATQKGYSFTVLCNPKDTTNKNSFYIALNFAEARYVREYIMNYLQTIFKKVSKPTSITSPLPEASPINQSSGSLVDI